MTQYRYKIININIAISIGIYTIQRWNFRAFHLFVESLSYAESGNIN